MDKRNVVKYKGKPTLYINETLLNNQDAWDNLDLIKSLHVKRLALEEAMKIMPTEDLSQADKDYTQIEFELQDAWGFPRSISFHKFWTRPRCTCPKMDNNDSYPTGYSYINDDCPLHGKP